MLIELDPFLPVSQVQHVSARFLNMNCNRTKESLTLLTFIFRLLLFLRVRSTLNCFPLFSVFFFCWFISFCGNLCRRHRCRCFLFLISPFFSRPPSYLSEIYSEQTPDEPEFSVRECGFLFRSDVVVFFPRDLPFL